MTNSILRHLSPLTSHLSPLTSHLSPLIKAIALFTILSPLTSHLTPPAVAQGEGHYRLADAAQLWRLSGNAAGLGLDAADNYIYGWGMRSYNRGYAEFEGLRQKGDYHRVQEGGQKNQLTFDTERYQKIGRRLVGYGRFSFGMDHTKDRAWADVMRPYNSNPFFSGSSVHGKYDTQRFDLTAALATRVIPIGGVLSTKRLNLGARLDYSVGDLSRLRDPRSRSELLQYRVSPAMAYTVGNKTLGLAGHYDRRKEKIPNITTVQEDPNLMYYQMTGMEQATGLVGGYSGFKREWVNHELGAELTFGFNTHSSASRHSSRFRSLNAVSIARGHEDVWGGQYKYSPGTYTSYIYSVSSHNRLLRSKVVREFDENVMVELQGMRLIRHREIQMPVIAYRLHEIDVEATVQQGYADELRQTLVQEKDPVSGYTSYRYDTQIEYRKRYQVKTYDAKMHYRYNVIGGNVSKEHWRGDVVYSNSAAIVGYLGATAQLQGALNKHLLPTSQLEYQRLNLEAEGGYGLMNGRVWLDAKAGYSLAPKAKLNLADATSTYAQEVLLPDFSYYDANYRHGQVSLKYLFPLTLKGSHNIAYIKVLADIVKAQHSMERKTVGVTFGLYN